MTMKGKIVLVAIGLVLLLLVACGPKEAPAPVEVIKEPPAKMEKKAPPVKETVEKAAVAAPEEASEVSEIESSSVEIEELEEGFDTSVLDQLDQDLADLDNLDLG